jgi:ribosomal protein S18 acetylase RimI-like enzyme
MPAGRPTSTEALTLRRATPGDAPDLARFVDMASEGLARVVWEGMAEPGEDLLAVGARRAARDEGAFSWRNAVIAELGGAVAGGLVAYRIGPDPEPLDEVPPLFRPLQALENRALDTHYVNVLATYPEFRRQGVARRLLAEAERQAAGARGLSLIVADRNLGARRLYEAFGFRAVAEEPMIKQAWSSDSDAWVLMLKPLRARHFKTGRDRAT